MSKQHFSPELKDEVVRQITERGYPVKEVSTVPGEVQC
jgi:transposase-like protein